MFAMAKKTKIPSGVVRIDGFMFVGGTIYPEPRIVDEGRGYIRLSVDGSHEPKDLYKMQKALGYGFPLYGRPCQSILYKGFLGYSHTVWTCFKRKKK